jgi:putative nucleotidyltransferase with HDIG domain
VWPLWRSHFMWIALNYFGGASVAALLVQNSRGVDPVSLSVIVPLLVITYLTFKTALGRVEDAHLHLAESNRLYISTVEALAMAIDAKDQITHGHIRRVQVYAVALAKALGLRDPLQLKALEAAALLHDMGKLAVPEHILNKPGTLTAAEFEKMKLHATVGADILSSIQFPYPVVPIVRHHHENWDGAGYPDGVKGTDIPIGARILAVVDCFDALTSDRPYRPALPDQAALEILSKRRGNMYDPLVVDAFLKLYPTLDKFTSEAHVQQPALTAITEAALAQTEKAAAAAQIDVAFERVLSIYELARTLPPNIGFCDAADIVGRHLNRLWEDTNCVFYVYEHSTDALTALHTVGPATTGVLGLHIPLGQRLSGWVAATRQSVVNSDPALDLSDIGMSRLAHLRSTLAAPLLADGDLVGVVSVYSARAEAFTQEHRQVLEAVARHMGPLLREALQNDAAAAALRDPDTGLPNAHAFERFISAEERTHRPWTPPFSVCRVEIVSLELLAKALNCDIVDDAPAALGRELRRTLRGGDLVFRCAPTTYTILLPQTDQPTAHFVVSRIQEICSVACDRGDAIVLRVNVATAPEDGITLTSIISTVSLVGVKSAIH